MANLTQREFESIFRCYQEFLKDSQNISASVSRVALVFDVSVRTVQNVLAEKKDGVPYKTKIKTCRQEISPLSRFSFKEQLNDFIFDKIKKNQHLTISPIHGYAKECLDFSYGRTTLYKIIKSIGYLFKKVDRRKVLIERQEIVNLRIRYCYKYLQLLKQFDMKFIFIDETWVYQNGSQVRQWVLETSSKGMPRKFKTEGKRYTIVNAGCELGFLPGCDLILDSKINDRDYHKTMNGDIFSKWAKQQLIPALNSLNCKCVVVMDNAPYHSVKIKRNPTASTKKADLQQWLRDHKISFDINSTKKNLWELIKAHLSESGNRYEIDEILRTAGHEVLRLPPYNCQYNPIELEWADCKTYYNRHILSQLDSRDRVKNVWQEALQQCTKEKWQNFIKHAEQEVRNDWHKYMGVDNVDDVPPFIINIESDSSSDCDSSNFEEATEHSLTDFDRPTISDLGVSSPISDQSESGKITIMLVDE